jgi:cytochrome c551/c552
MRKLRKFGLVFIAMALCAAGSSLFAKVVKIVLPPETGTFKVAAGSDLANAQCLTCHSVEYVTMQPPKPLDFWTGEVKKMRDKYGAQFPAEYTPELANYLVANYGISTNKAVAASSVVSPSAVAASSQPTNVVVFATIYGCLSCHKVEAKVVGPAFKDVAAKYRNDPAAFDKIAEQIHHGGTGKWGPAVMPPFTMVTDAQAKMLATWIMGLNSGQ